MINSPGKLEEQIKDQKNKDKQSDKINEQFSKECRKLKREIELCILLKPCLEMGIKNAQKDIKKKKGSKKKDWQKK